VRGLGLSFLVRRARSGWLLLACVTVAVLVATGLATALWAFTVAVIPPGAQRILGPSQSRVVGLSGVVDAGQAAADSSLIRTTLGKAWPGVGFQMESALWAQTIQLPTPPGLVVTPFHQPTPVATTVARQIQPASLAGISAQATLTAGSWPGPPRPGRPLPVALPAVAASGLHVKVGSVLTGTRPSGGAPTSMLVTGLYRPRDPTSPYWKLDLLPASGMSVQNMPGGVGDIDLYGPALVSPAAFGGVLTVDQASWMVLPQAAAMAHGNVAALAANTSAAFSQLAVVLPEGVQAASSLPQLLSGTASTIVLARSLFTIGALLLLLVAGVGLVLVARLLANLREEESALLRARGATRWQVARPVLAESVVLGAAAGLVGVLAGARLTGVLADLGDVRLDGYSGIPALAWQTALAMLVICAAVMTWPALRVLTPDAARRRRGRQARLAAIAWAGGDLALVALAAVSVWELHGYSAVAHSTTGTLGIDPVVAIAPALALAGTALVPLRGLPLLGRLADKATDHERRLAAPMVSWQIARRPIRQAGPVLLVIITTATTTLGLAGYGSWRQSTADQAAFAVGSDVRVDSGSGLAANASGSVIHAPGVTAATPASLVALGNGSQLIALNASTAGQTILLRPDLSPLPLSALWRLITPRQLPGMTLPGQSDRLEVTAALGAASNSSLAEVRTAIQSATVMASFQDADGAAYQVLAAESLPADGRPHSVVFTLPGPQQASYPLRLLGLAVSYLLPPYDPARPTYSPTADLSIRSLAVADTATGPFGRPFSDGAALAAWLPTGSAPAVPTGPVGAFGGMPPSDGTPPSIGGWQSADGAVQVIFDTGHEPSVAVMDAQEMSPAPGLVAVSARVTSLVIPAIATAGYLTANRLRVGSTVPVTLGGYPVTIQIVASVTRFPTVYGQNRALITDLTVINDLLVAVQGQPLPVSRWWLRTAGGRVPALPAGLGLSVTNLASQRAVLFGNPLLTAPRQALLVIGVAAVLIGVLGFSVSIAASLRSRRTQSAVFAALGVGKNAQAGHLCLEQCALSIPAAAAGLLAGIGLAQLIVPAITLTTDAAEPFPSALVVVPLGPAVGLALLTAAAPVAAAALSVLRRPEPAARLRAEAE
jgi:hypothetical protein